MPGPNKRKRFHRGDTHLQRKWRTRNRTKDLDEIDSDLQPKKAKELLNQEIDPDQTGCAQHYCIHCGRYFIDDQALAEHCRTKFHKRRLKELETEPYTIEESERAAGVGSYVAPKKRKLDSVADLKDGTVLMDSSDTKPVTVS
nr:PREDICTED: zinc finger protein 593 homolog isoform X2 [Bemisia tabaci]